MAVPVFVVCLYVCEYGYYSPISMLLSHLTMLSSVPQASDYHFCCVAWSSVCWHWHTVPFSSQRSKRSLPDDAILGGSLNLVFSVYDGSWSEVVHVSSGAIQSRQSLKEIVEKVGTCEAS